VAEIVHSRCADEVWLVPCGPRPDKPGLKTPPIDRFCMCEIAVNTIFTADFPIRVDSIECFSEEAFATYDLLCNLREQHPDCDFSFIIGSDWLQPGSNLATWTSKNHDWKPGDPDDHKTVVTGHKMLAEFDFLVIRRPGYDVRASSDDPSGLGQFGPRLSWLVMPSGQTFIEGNLSSTEIRKRTAFAARVRDAVSSKDFVGIDGLVPPGVLAYIRRQELYSMKFS
jgi:nicotinic acid mononucleotide adenylyltransferase